MRKKNTYYAGLNDRAYAPLQELVQEHGFEYYGYYYLLRELYHQKRSEQEADQVIITIKELSDLWHCRKDKCKKIISNFSKIDQLITNYLPISCHVRCVKSLKLNVPTQKTQKVLSKYSQSTRETKRQKKTKKAVSNVRKKVSTYPVEYLNQKLKKRFSPTNKDTLLKLKKLAEYSDQDFKDVIDLKCKQWLFDPIMNKFLKPSTLFAPSNFIKYLDEAQSGDGIIKPDGTIETDLIKQLNEWGAGTPIE